MGAYDVDLPKMKTPGMENPPQVAPPVNDPNKWIVDAAQGAANLRNNVQAINNAPTPKAAPLLGPDAGSTILPMLQAGDAAMRAAGGAVSGAATAVSDKMGEYDAQARTAEAPNGPYTPSGTPLPTMLTAGSNANPGNSFNEWVDNKALPAAGQFFERMSPAYAHAAAASDLPATEFDKQYFAPKAAPAPTAAVAAPAAAPAPTVAPVATPAKVETPAAGPTKENGYALPEIAPKTPTAGAQELINRQNASRTPVTDAYSGPAAAATKPATGMPAPGTAGGADLNGTPSQQTAYWAAQKAGLQERERYADQQNLQHQYLNMMLADQDFRQQAYQQAIGNPNLGPATLAAIAAMTGHNSGAAAPATGAGKGMVDVNHTTAQQQTAQAQNATTARGQDLTFAGHKLTNENDMAKANLNAAVQREGQQVTERVHKADSEARTAQNNATNQTHLTAAEQAAKVQKEIAAMNANKMVESRNTMGFLTNGAGEVIDRRAEYGMVKPKK